MIIRDKLVLPNPAAQIIATLDWSCKIEPSLIFLPNSRNMGQVFRTLMQ